MGLAELAASYSKQAHEGAALCVFFRGQHEIRDLRRETREILAIPAKRRDHQNSG